MVQTPASPVTNPSIIHLVIFAHFVSRIVNSVINNGTRAAMIAAKPLLIYSMDQVRNPLAMHNNKIPCKEICFISLHVGKLYPFNKKNPTNINPDKNWRTPETNIPGICCVPILEAIYVVPQKKLTTASAIYPC